MLNVMGEGGGGGGAEGGNSVRGRTWTYAEEGKRTGVAERGTCMVCLSVRLLRRARMARDGTCWRKAHLRRLCPHLPLAPLDGFSRSSLSHSFVAFLSGAPPSPNLSGCRGRCRQAFCVCGCVGGEGEGGACWADGARLCCLHCPLPPMLMVFAALACPCFMSAPCSGGTRQTLIDT